MERVGFEPSVTFEIPLRELAPYLAHNSVPEKQILNQREVLGFDSAFQISLIPFLHNCDRQRADNVNIM